MQDTVGTASVVVQDTRMVVKPVKGAQSTAAGSERIPNTAVVAAMK